MSPGSASLLSPGDVDVHDQPAVERHHEAPTHARFVDVEAADDVARAALEDPHDPALGAAIGDPLDPGDDAIAVHRLIEVAAGHVDVAGDLFQGAGPGRRSRIRAGWS